MELFYCFVNKSVNKTAFSVSSVNIYNLRKVDRNNLLILEVQKVIETEKFPKLIIHLIAINEDFSSNRVGYD